MAVLSQFRCDIADVEQVVRLREAPLPLGLRSTPPERSFHRDIYLDTSDRSLASRGVTCRLRIQADDRRFLTLVVAGDRGSPPLRWDAEVPELDARKALEGTSEPARRLRGLTDPTLLRPRIELETERWTRMGSAGWFRWIPRFAFLYDVATVRLSGLSRSFQELQVRRVAEGGPSLEQIAAALERTHGLRPLLVPKADRAIQLNETIASEVAARNLGTQRGVALVAYDSGGIAFQREQGELLLPLARGSGEESCRYLLRHLFGSGVGELSLLGNVPPTEDRPALDVWVARKIRGIGEEPTSTDIVWLTLPQALAKIGTPEIRAPETLAVLALAARMDLGPETSPHAGRRSQAVQRTDGRSAVAPSPLPRPRRSPKSQPAAALQPDQCLNAELSQLAFHLRVLELAEDPGMPLAERLRYLAIVSSNLDEFFSVRVGALKTAIVGGSPQRSIDGLSPSEQVDAISTRVVPMIARQTLCMQECLGAVGQRGFGLRRWADLSEAARAELTTYFERQLLPVLTPRAVTMSPGHPFPVIPQLTLAFAVLVRDIHTGPVHFAYLAIPARLTRLMAVPGGNDLIPIEEVVRANLQAFYPDRPIEEAWVFRVTRGADLSINEEDSGDLLQAIEEEVRRRALNHPVRVEVDGGMPALVRELLLRELRFERRGVTAALGDADIYSVDGLMDRTCLRDVADLLPPTDAFAVPAGQRRLPTDQTMIDQLEHGDILVHHPYEDFQGSVARFIEEAAADPDVVGIKITLYRTGDKSSVVDGLVEAARRGKEVSAFVEVKARFDEARNVQWVKRLEEVGAQVVYGIVGLKTHAKVTLVVRQAPDGIRRYAHIGTGNYNAATARYYADLGLFTAEEAVTADLTDLFNQLTGSTQAPTGQFRRLLVSPVNMIPELIRRIEREIAFVDEGPGGRIRMQLNGLEDPDLVAALYRAAQAGVEIDLVIRGLCILKPGVPGLSERIRVKSVLGRFLEHERIFHFGNGVKPEYLIGSADLRPRNLRRRVEVVVPVRQPDHVARLDRLLTELLDEPAAWTLAPDGTYSRSARPSADHPHLHDRLLAEG